MRKRTNFASRRSQGWPDPSQLEHYFLSPPGQQWFFELRNDSGGLTAEGVHDTEHLELGKGRVDIHLMMDAHPTHGVLLTYMKLGGSFRDRYYSWSDLNRLQEWVWSLHGSLFPVGLFIPFEEAWKAVKEFIETDGTLPRSIAWIDGRDLPPDAFPDIGQPNLREKFAHVPPR